MVEFLLQGKKKIKQTPKMPLLFLLQLLGKKQHCGEEEKH